MTLWSGRFDTAPDPAAFDFQVSFGFDRALFEDDVTGSLAWAEALGAAGVLSKQDLAAIRQGLEEILEAGRRDPAYVAGPDEDVHSFVERTLVEKIGEDSVTVHLVNTSGVNTRRVIVQMGAYGEHQAVSVTTGGRSTPVDAPWFEVRLAPGAADQLTISVRRYVNDPTLAFPWDRGWWNNQPVPPAGRGRGRGGPA